MSAVNQKIDFPRQTQTYLSYLSNLSNVTNNHGGSLEWLII
jgi:hypothetical protein